MTGRRTQEERTAATREALLDATVDCLIDLGYARTTTREVAQRAGVSRGAQTHHFPTKDDLVIAAVEHLFAVQGRRFAERYLALPPDRQSLDEGVGLLWEIVSGRPYAAVLEVVVAGRTDPALGVAVQAVAATLREQVVELFCTLDPVGSDDHRWVGRVIDAVFAVVQGAAIAAYGGFGDPDAVIATVRRLAPLARPDTLNLPERSA